jgi:Flp pilus assembly protein TadG
MKRQHCLASKQARPRERGAAAVEFALVSMVFFLLLIGAMEFGRILYYWNVTAEATRLGARLAVVCDYTDADAVRARMNELFPTLSANDISYVCSNAGCDSVTVSINPGKGIPTFIPWAALNLVLPPFTTTLPRESMQSTFDGTANPVCQ